MGLDPPDSRRRGVARRFRFVHWGSVGSHCWCDPCWDIGVGCFRMAALLPGVGDPLRHSLGVYHLGTHCPRPRHHHGIRRNLGRLQHRLTGRTGDEIEGLLVWGTRSPFRLRRPASRHPHISAVVCGADAAERARADPEWKGSVYGSPEVCGIQLVAFDSRHRAGVSQAGSRTDGRCLHPWFSNRTKRNTTEREQQRSRVAFGPTSGLCPRGGDLRCQVSSHCNFALAVLRSTVSFERSGP